MPNEQDPRNTDYEPESSDELSNEELDQVVGGTDPKPTTTSTRPSVSEIVITKVSAPASP